MKQFGGMVLDMAGWRKLKPGASGPAGWEVGCFPPQNPRKAQEFQALGISEVEVRVRPTESKKSSGISGLRHQWGAGGLAELFSPGPYLPTFSSQVLPFPHPCRRWKVSFLKRLSHRYGSRIPGDGKTGTFTENRNWENFQTYRQPTGMWKDARHL